MKLFGFASVNLNEDIVGDISPKKGWQIIDVKELIQYRDLFYFMVWREIKVLYAQTILGFSWALLQPLIQIVIFTVVFGKVAKVSSEGVPYFLFSTVAIIPWTWNWISVLPVTLTKLTTPSRRPTIWAPAIPL